VLPQSAHKVEDFERWKPVFDATAALKRGYGWKQFSVFAIDGDRNNVLVMEEFDTMANAKAFDEVDVQVRAQHGSHTGRASPGSRCSR